MAADQIFCPSCGTANQIHANYCFKCGGTLPTSVTPKIKDQPSDFITLVCPKCGGKLQVESNTNQLTCQYCGLEHLVRHNGDSVTLTPVVEGIKRVEGKFDQILTGSDRMAAEQTIQRLKVEMPEYEARVKNLQDKYNHEVNKKPFNNFIKFILYFVSILCIIYMLIFVIGSFIEPPPTPVIVIMVVATTLLIICISIIKKMRQNEKNPTKILAINGELDQAKKEYQERKNQLEQLHRYTAQR